MLPSDQKVRKSEKTSVATILTIDAFSTVVPMRPLIFLMQFPLWSNSFVVLG